MANIFLAWQNRADESALSGGSWLSTLPLTNLQNRQLQKVARSSNATAAATQFSIDVGQARAIGVMSLVNHNISAVGRVKVSAGESAASITNLWTTFASEFNNAAWTKTNVNVITDGTTAPDGSTTADGLTATAGGGSATVHRDIALGGTSTVTHAVYLKFGSVGAAGVKLEWFSGGTAQTASADIDLTTGVVSNITGTASSIAAYSVDVGDGWWRVYLTGTGTSAGNTQVRYTIINNQAGRTIYAWGAFVAATVPPIHESRYVLAWPEGVMPPELLEWEGDNFWLGTLTQEVRDSYQSPFIYRLPEIETARYWKVEIIDTANPDGYVESGRLFIARGWTPSVNYNYGGSIEFNDPTPVDTSLSGVEYFDTRLKFRVFSFTLDYINEGEAYSYALDLQRVAGVSGEVLVMPDGGENLSLLPSTCFVGRLRQLGSISQPQPNAYSVKFEIKELL